MKASTIKLEEPLLRQLYELIPEGVSLSRFVKDILQGEVRKSKMQKAALEYNKFLSEDEEEQNFLNEWEEADLSADPSRCDQSTTDK